jgi:DNA invertase Pin-like site-specific DNA recombinase
MKDVHVTMLRYIIYVRKSQEARDRQALSLESQIRELQEYAKREGLIIVEIIQEAQSAYKPGRPKFARALELCRNGVANAILVWKPDRISRNAQDGGAFIQAMDDGIIKELRTPFECFRAKDNRMMLYIHFGMSNDYSRQISANVKRGYRQKYERGEYCSQAPLGYLNAKVGSSRNIIPDPNTAPLIKRLFEAYATESLSLSDLA